MNYKIKALIGILFLSIGGVLAIMGFAGFLHGLILSLVAEYNLMELLLITGPPLVAIGLYLTVSAAVASAQ